MSADFADRLLAWHDEHGRRGLPWQQPREPYRVWISEIMLQQTQVATVIPYFERWMQAFPDLPALAAAAEDEVLGHWSGLGYYARARNLLETARRCMREHGGELPLNADALNALPGIGPSTANAIISQSTDRPAAVLDGNVRRVMARHAAVEGWSGTAAVQRRLWQEAEARLPASRGADYTQAVMDLGALLCRARKPCCDDCPVRADCLARKQGLLEEIPARRPPARVRERTLHMLLARDAAGRVLLEKRPGAGIWGGLWCLPEAGSAEALAEALGMGLLETRDLPPVEHRLSHLKLTIRPRLATPGRAERIKCTPEQDWFDRGQQRNLGLPKPVAELLARLDNGEFE